MVVVVAVVVVVVEVAAAAGGEGGGAAVATAAAAVVVVVAVVVTIVLCCLAIWHPWSLSHIQPGVTINSVAPTPRSGTCPHCQQFPISDSKRHRSGTLTLDEVSASSGCCAQVFSFPNAIRLFNSNNCDNDCGMRPGDLMVIGSN